MFDMVFAPYFIYSMYERISAKCYLNLKALFTASMALWLLFFSSRTCLVPPSTTLLNSSREMSLESGYNSHSSPLSTPSTPRSLSARGRRSARGITNRLANKSMSVDASTSSSSPPCGVRSQVRKRRKEKTHPERKYNLNVKLKY